MAGSNGLVKRFNLDPRVYEAFDPLIEQALDALKETGSTAEQTGLLETQLVTMNQVGGNVALRPAGAYLMLAYGYREEWFTDTARVRQAMKVLASSSSLPADQLVGCNSVLSAHRPNACDNLLVRPAPSTRCKTCRRDTTILNLELKPSRHLVTYCYDCEVVVLTGPNGLLEVLALKSSTEQVLVDLNAARDTEPETAALSQTSRKKLSFIVLAGQRAISVHGCYMMLAWLHVTQRTSSTLERIGDIMLHCTNKSQKDDRWNECDAELESWLGPDVGLLLNYQRQQVSAPPTHPLPSATAADAVVDALVSSYSVEEIKARLDGKVLNRNWVTQTFAGLVWTMIRRKCLKKPREAPQIINLYGPPGTAKDTTLNAAAEQVLHYPKDHPARIEIMGGELKFKSDLTKLQGSAPSYVGHGSYEESLVARLTRAIAWVGNQNRIILLVINEMQEMDPAIHGYLAQIYEYPFSITDGEGKRVLTNRPDILVALVSNIGETAMLNWSKFYPDRPLTPAIMAKIYERDLKNRGISKHAVDRILQGEHCGFPALSRQEAEKVVWKKLLDRLHDELPFERDQVDQRLVDCTVEKVMQSGARIALSHLIRSLEACLTKLVVASLNSSEPPANELRLTVQQQILKFYNPSTGNVYAEEPVDGLFAPTDDDDIDYAALEADEHDDNSQYE